MASVFSWVGVAVLFAIGITTAPFLSFPIPFSSSTLGSSSSSAHSMLKEDPEVEKALDSAQKAAEKMNEQIKNAKQAGGTSGADPGAGTSSSATGTEAAAAPAKKKDSERTPSAKPETSSSPTGTGTAAEAGSVSEHNKSSDGNTSANSGNDSKTENVAPQEASPPASSSKKWWST